MDDKITKKSKNETSATNLNKTSTGGSSMKKSPSNSKKTNTSNSVSTTKRKTSNKSNKVSENNNDEKNKTDAASEQQATLLSNSDSEDDENNSPRNIPSSSQAPGASGNNTTSEKGSSSSSTPSQSKKSRATTSQQQQQSNPSNSQSPSPPNNHHNNNSNSDTDDGGGSSSRNNSPQPNKTRGSSTSTKNNKRDTTPEPASPGGMRKLTSEKKSSSNRNLNEGGSSRHKHRDRNNNNNQDGAGSGAASGTTVTVTTASSTDNQSSSNAPGVDPNVDGVVDYYISGSFDENSMEWTSMTEESDSIGTPANSENRKSGKLDGFGGGSGGRGGSSGNLDDLDSTADSEYSEEGSGGGGGANATSASGSQRKVKNTRKSSTTNIHAGAIGSGNTSSSSSSSLPTKPQIVYRQDSNANSLPSATTSNRSRPINHATVDGLFSLLADHQLFSDKTFLDTFILSYEYFMDTATFLKKLISHYQNPRLSTTTGSSSSTAAGGNDSYEGSGSGIDKGSPSSNDSSSPLARVDKDHLSTASQSGGNSPHREQSALSSTTGGGGGTTPTGASGAPTTNAVTSAQDQQAIIFFQLRVINVLKKLIETRYFDIKKNKTCLNIITRFIKRLSTKGDDKEKGWANHLRSSVRQNSEFIRSAGDDGSGIGDGGDNNDDSIENSKGSTSSRSGHSNTGDSPSNSSKSIGSIPPSGLGGPQKSVLDFNAKDLAVHLTLIDYELWSGIKLDEFYHTAFQSKEKDKIAPGITKYTKRFNDVSAWVSSSIVLAPKKKQRVLILTKFIQILEELRRLRNYNGMMAFFSALNLMAIQRLKKTWKEVSSKVMTMFNNVSKFMDSSQNYKTYKDHLKVADPPAIPYVGFILTDLVYTEEFPTFIEEKVDNDDDSDEEKSKKEEVDPSQRYVNWNKMCMLAATFGDILRFQRTKFQVTEMKEVADFVSDLSRHSWFLNETELLEISRNIEPDDSSNSGSGGGSSSGNSGNNSPQVSGGGGGGGGVDSPGKSKSKFSLGGSSKKSNKNKVPPTWEDLSRDLNLFADFKVYLQGRYNSENLLFWEAVTKFKALNFGDNAASRSKADEIHQKFITGTLNNGELIIGINAAIAREIKKHMDADEITPVLFDRALEEVEHVTLKPNFADYIKTL